MAGISFSQIKLILLIFIGGGLGSVFRYLLSKWLNPLVTGFPLGTLLVNIAACFVLGLIISFAEYKQVFNESIRVFLIVGFCGGFSTFSAFSFETFQLLNNGYSLTGIFYVILSVGLCLSFTFIGYSVFK